MPSPGLLSVFFLMQISLNSCTNGPTFDPAPKKRGFYRLVESADNHYSYVEGVPYPLSEIKKKKSRMELPPIPQQFNFREKWNASLANKVHDQGLCGSCWAISSADCAAGYALNWTSFHGEPIVNELFSSQYLLNCDHTCQTYDAKDCQNGCNGGYSNLAFNFIAKNGIPTDKCLSYNENNGTCASSCDGGGNITYFTKEKCGFEAWVYYPQKAIHPIDDIRLILALWGPAAVNYEIFKSFKAFNNQFKEGKIYTKAKSERQGTGEYHAVALYGYGQKNGTNYWLVKNSWGPEWGDEGFFRIRAGTNECNIEDYVVFFAPENPSPYLSRATHVAPLRTSHISLILFALTIFSCLIFF